jgi:hypothetical protein
MARPGRRHEGEQRVGRRNERSMSFGSCESRKRRPLSHLVLAHKITMLLEKSIHPSIVVKVERKLCFVFRH